MLTKKSCFCEIHTLYILRPYSLYFDSHFLDVDCGAPANIDNGKVTLASNATYYGALALYSCDNNFELDGVSRRLCLENGTWSSDTPACKGMLLCIKFTKQYRL